MIRHPLIVVRLAFTRAVNRLMKLARRAQHKIKYDEQYIKDIEELVSDLPSNESWKESSPHIAKILFAGVSENHRGRHVGRMLLESVLKILSDRGVRRADGIILLHNIPSIRMIYRLGFDIYRKGGFVFVTKHMNMK